MSQNRLLTELERQDKYLAELPDSFEFPLFNSAKALESQRRSGYRTTASAAREIVDNSIEAGAGRVHVVFDKPRGNRKAHERKDSVSGVAFIDDGAGMRKNMARYALSWGGGTHFDDHEFIGKFGFGLPNASINQTRRVEVYTRTSRSERFTKAWLDITDYKGFAVQSIPEPIEADLPAFVQEYLDREGWKLDHGTVVVWVKPDRLSLRSAASLKEHIVDDFGVTYRYLLRDFELKVEGVTVQPVDPLFLDPKSRFYVPPVPGSADKGGSQLVLESSIPVMFTEDPETGSRHLRKIEDQEDLGDPNFLQQGVIHVRIARLPVGFAVSKGRKGKSSVEPMDDESAHRFEIRKPRRGMSFVRANREIHTLDVFPHRTKDEASGLGKWPLLQGYAYHWGIEVKFDPQLDDVFGIGNDKQTVRPIEDFWRVLADEGIDRLLNRENSWQSKQRHDATQRHMLATLELDSDEPKPAELAAQAADVALGTKPRVPERERVRVREETEQKATEEAARDNRPLPEVRKAMEERANRRRYRVELVDAPHGYFFVPKWEATAIVVELNRRHPFFEILYGGLVGLPGGGRAKEAVDLLLFALAKGELGDNEATAELYRMQRETLWSPFLATAMRDLAGRFEVTQAEEEVENEELGEEAA